MGANSSRFTTFVVIMCQLVPTKEKVSDMCRMMLLCSVLLFSGLQALAQSNPNLIELSGITDQPVEITLKSAQQVAPQNFDNGFSYIAAGPNPQEYVVTIVPDAGFKGEISVVVTYYSFIGPPLYYKANTTTISVTFGDAVLLSDDDFVTVDSTVLDISPLTNDSSSAGEVWLKSIVYVGHGSAVMTDSSTITYTSPAEEVDLDYIVYAAEDDQGMIGHATIYLAKEDQDADLSGQLNYIIGNTETQIVQLPEAGMTTSSSLAFGSLDSYLDGLLYRYTPNENSVGTDSLVFTSLSGTSRDVLITVKDYMTAPLVSDDVVYTPVNTAITFDAWANDNFNGNVYLDWHSAELVNDSLGVFTYMPDSNFSGIVTLSYIVDNGFGFHEATITIYVGDQAPVAQQYLFGTPQDERLVLRYEVASDGYTLDIAGDPDHGYAVAYDGTTTVSTGCQDVTGKYFILYTPDQGYVGVDSLTVRYCAANGSCVDYPVAIEVYADSNSDCRCLQGCVWAGDANQDGRVNVRDILPIAEVLGEGELARSDIDYGVWEAQDADDWSISTAAGINLKHADADGDGVVTAADTDQILTNYDAVHTLVPTDLLDYKAYPLTLIPHSTDVDSGDLMVIDIALGNPNFPVEDLQGFALGFNINPGFADSSSLQLDFVDNGWFAANGPTLEMSVTPRDGRVEAAFGKANGFNANGYGVVGQLSFIVEDDAEGLRENLNATTRQIKVFTDAPVITDGNGTMYRLPDAQASVTLHLNRDQQPLDVEDLIVFPNPTSDQLRLHLNGGYSFSQVNVYNMMGSMVIGDSVGQTNSHYMDVSNLLPAVYVVEVITPEGALATKFIKQ